MHNSRNNSSLQPYLVNSAKVCQLLGISRTTLWRWKAKNDKFPQPVQLSSNVQRWRIDDVIAFADNGIEGGEQ